MGLREDKKKRTRDRIADTAWTLFADRGFDQVTVAQVAAAAGVAEATVFNYFDTKEDLFFERLDRYGHELVEAVAGRPAGESALAAFRRELFASQGLLRQLDGDDPQPLDRLRTVNRVIAGSPALQARELMSLTRIGDALAARLGGDPLTARVVAHSLIAVQRSLVLLVREAVLAGDVPPGLADRVAAAGARAFAVLEDGLGGVGARGFAALEDGLGGVGAR
ncbi:TetR/AcrR family transcriptional regulator [Actinoplanes sp. URMC 104]|uniref:TetR/AcrR family transcriptional regulator n=1 Tax=Actinoplanes sp. URMC 104 TaxID=3423409 RepID=UPI003F1C09E0